MWRRAGAPPDCARTEFQGLGLVRERLRRKEQRLGWKAGAAGCEAGDEVRSQDRERRRKRRGQPCCSRGGDRLRDKIIPRSAPFSHRVIPGQVGIVVCSTGGAALCYRTICAEGCDAAVPGCTEIPLLMNGTSSPLPVLDSTRLLANAALSRAARMAAAGAKADR